MAPPGVLVRLLTCGSVDDGKSTLLGRILHESGQIYHDARAALDADSRRHGTTGSAPDYALLMDGLEAEREQGITIDVAHRRFRTAHRAFLALDAPGHEQYTRNMVTAASSADVALVLVDASKGLLAQTRRHATICGLMRVPHVVLAVNKMDLVGYAREAFEGIAAAFAAFARPLGFASVTAVPVSARNGDNVSERTPALAWFDGPTLVAAIEAPEPAAPVGDFRIPVQIVLRPDADFRGVAGTVASGAVAVGEAIAVAASGATARVSRILGVDGEVQRAGAGEAVTLSFASDIDVARGDLLAPATARPAMADQFAAQLVWMGSAPLLAGRQYLMRMGTGWTPATVTHIKHAISIETLERLAATELKTNDLGVVTVATQTPVPVEAFADNKATGAFILVDRATHETAAAGMVLHSLRRATNVHWSRGVVDRQMRAASKGQKPACLWFTGLSGSGKSTIVNALEQRLHALGRHAMTLDGDNLRHGLNRDLGFTDADRVENIRRVAEVAKLFTDAGLIVLCAFISPFRSDRAMARALFAEGEFIEVFVDTPLDECIRRDPKGLYAKALAGEIPNFTGLGSAYEAPEAPEMRLAFDAAQHDTDEGVAAHVEAILRRLGL